MKKRKLKSGQVERQIITGMIVSDRFLRELLTFYFAELLTTPFTRTVAKWCAEYYEEYSAAPRQHIQDIFHSHQRKALPSDQSDLIEDFLASISEEFEGAERFNVDYALDQAEQYFKTRKLEQLSEDIRAILSTGQPAEAEIEVLNYKQVARAVSVGIDPFSDIGEIEKAIDEQGKDVLFTPPGALGEFVGPIVRTDFVGLMAPEKRGKSFWLRELGLWSLRASQNTALIVIGDMSSNEYMRYIHSRNTSTNIYKAGAYKLPVLDCYKNQNDSCQMPERTGSFGVIRSEGSEGDFNYTKAEFEDEPDYVPCSFCRREAPKEFQGAFWWELRKVEKLTVLKATREAIRFKKRIGKKRMRLQVYSEASIQTIRNQLDLWEINEGFVPDVIIIDYADNIDTIGNDDFRHREDKKWKDLRAIALERHCAVITATQTDAASYDARRIQARHFTETKGKYRHVTKILTLNQTEQEKDDGILRIGQMMVRGRGYSTRKMVYVLEGREISRPYLGSYHAPSLKRNESG